MGRFAKVLSLMRRRHDGAAVLRVGEGDGQDGIVRRHALVWVTMVAIAVANSALRQTKLGKVLPELRAHQLSTLIGSVLLGAFIWVVMQQWPPSSRRAALGIGVLRGPLKCRNGF